MPRTPSLVLEAESPAPTPRAQFSEAGSPMGCLASPEGLPPAPSLECPRQARGSPPPRPAHRRAVDRADRPGR